jgi:hypothetical protein
MRKKEALGRIFGGLGILAGGLFEYCNSSLKRRVVSVICVVLLIFFVFKFFSSVASTGGVSGSIEALSVKDSRGNKWILEPIKGQPLSKFAKGGDEPGEPLIIDTDVQNEGSEVSIGLIVAGSAGEKYVGGAIRNNERMPAPTFKIINEEKKVLGTGAFEYG